jgi:hypothetical protein
VIEQMLDVAARAREEIVDAKHLTAAPEQLLAKMRADKPSAAGNENAFFEMHAYPSEIRSQSEI